MKKKRKCHKNYNEFCETCNPITQFKFVPSTLRDRINFLREVILQVTPDHGNPCCCRLCEALMFDTLAAEGTLNLKTGERNDFKRK